MGRKKKFWEKKEEQTVTDTQAPAEPPDTNVLFGMMRFVGSSDNAVHYVRIDRIEYWRDGLVCHVSNGISLLLPVHQTADEIAMMIAEGINK